jgi:hypothetical protein
MRTRRRSPQDQSPCEYSCLSIYFCTTADGISFFLYYVFFGIGMQVRIPSCLPVSDELLTGRQGVPWLYPTEINSLAMRTKGAAIGTATNWIFNFMGELSPSRRSITNNEIGG